MGIKTTGGTLFMIKEDGSKLKIGDGVMEPNDIEVNSTDDKIVRKIENTPVTFELKISWWRALLFKIRFWLWWHLG